MPRFKLNVTLQSSLVYAAFLVSSREDVKLGETGSAEISSEECPEAIAPFVEWMKARPSKNMASTNTNTVRLQPAPLATPERDSRAFLDPSAMAKGFPPNGFTAKEHQMDRKVAGTCNLSFTNFRTGNLFPA